MNHYVIATVSGGAVRTLTYDANGNLTNDGAGRTYTYDAANRLISITQASGVTGFVYDGYGRRVQQTSNGTVVKQWVWCSGVQPCEERDASNNVTKRFYKRGEQINGTAYFWTRDRLRSVREMTDSSGNLVARYDYDPYGRRTLVSGTDIADFGFTGFYHDQATGLDLSRTRPYIADLGRWIQPDPIGERGGTNRYRYVHNNPVNVVDPMGLQDAPSDSDDEGGSPLEPFLGPGAVMFRFTPKTPQEEPEESEPAEPAGEPNNGNVCSVRQSFERDPLLNLIDFLERSEKGQSDEVIADMQRMSQTPEGRQTLQGIARLTNQMLNSGEVKSGYAGTILNGISENASKFGSLQR